MKQRILKLLRGVVCILAWYVFSFQSIHPEVYEYVQGLDGTEIPLSFDIMYPDSAFHKVETLCKDLWNDLDIVLHNKSLRDAWMLETDYIVEQLFALYIAVDLLVTEAHEQHTYLYEDIEYVINVFGHVAQKMQKLITYLEDDVHTIDHTLAKIQHRLHDLHAANLEEVVG